MCVRMGPGQPDMRGSEKERKEENNSTDYHTRGNHVACYAKGEAGRPDRIERDNADLRSIPLATATDLVSNG